MADYNDEANSSGDEEGAATAPPPVANNEGQVEWTPDEQAATCQCCRTIVFKLLNRRHHCRACGRVVCSRCSK